MTSLYFNIYVYLIQLPKYKKIKHSETLLLVVIYFISFMKLFRDYYLL